MRQERARRRMHLAGWAIPIAAAAVAVATIVGPLRPASHTTYAQLSPVLAMLDVAASGCLLIVGWLAWVWDRRGIGLLALLAGVCWFGLDWAGDIGLPPFVRVAGAFAVSLTLPLLVHLVLRATRSDGGSIARFALAIIYAAAGALAVAHLAVYVPKLDLRCLALCDLGPITGVGNHSVARELDRAQDLLTALGGVGLVVWSALALARSAAAVRRDRIAVLGPAILVGLAWSAWAIASLEPSTVTPQREVVMASLYGFQALSVVILALGIGRAVSVGHRTLLAVQGIARQLSGSPDGGALQPAVAAALRDPGLRLVYPLPDGSGLVSDDGHMVDDHHSLMVPIHHAGHVAALVVPSREPSDVRAIGTVGAAVRLAAENERLLAVVRHELLELRASRARIVQTGDAARERLERDLHDGAQQRLLAIVYELAFARDRAHASGDEAVAARLSDALVVVDDTTEALRRIGRGIHDPVLTEAGLADALESLAVHSPMPVDVIVDGSVSCGTAPEVTVWRVVAHAIRLAFGAASTSVSARVSQASGELRLAVEIEGAERPIDLLGIDDRVAASGGELQVGATPNGVLGFQVRLPCA